MAIVQVLVSGISLSGYYALVAIGFVLIFSTVRVFHIAHASVFVAGGYTLFFLHKLLGFDLWLSGAAAMVVAAALGLAIDRLVYIPVERRGGGLFALFIASLGVALFIEAVSLAWSRGLLSVARTTDLGILMMGQVAVRTLDMTMIAAMAVIYGLLHLWLYRTKVGLQIRGLADNPALASVVGVNVGMTRNAIFVLASALAGLAGMFTAYDTGITPDSGMKVLFIAVVAVVLGGTRNLMLGTIIGAASIGILSALAGFTVPEWVTFSVFLTLILLLVVRPQGLLGGMAVRG